MVAFLALCHLVSEFTVSQSVLCRQDTFEYYTFIDFKDNVTMKFISVFPYKKYRDVYPKSIYISAIILVTFIFIDLKALFYCRLLELSQLPSLE